MKILQKVVFLTLAITLSSCAAMNIAISKRSLDVQTKMSNTIFLDPVASSKKIIFIQIRNTSDKPSFNIKEEIKQNILSRGYKITDDPDKAFYVLQVNILQVGKSDPTAAQSSLSGGYGESLLAGTAGAIIGGRNGSTSGMVAGGLIGAGATFVANSLVKDVYYSIITGIQISARAKKGIIVTNQSKHELAQGNSGSTKSTFTETSNMKKYQTRVLSSANKVNLKWEDASTELVNSISASIAGIF